MNNKLHNIAVCCIHDLAATSDSMLQSRWNFCFFATLQTIEQIVWRSHHVRYTRQNRLWCSDNVEQNWPLKVIKWWTLRLLTIYPKSNYYLLCLIYRHLFVKRARRSTTLVQKMVDIFKIHWISARCNFIQVKCQFVNAATMVMQIQSYTMQSVFI